MSLDLTGIQNIGEFYSHHYLDALLEQDLKGLFAKWREGDETTPDRLLYRLAGEFFKAKSDAHPELSIESRYAPSHRIHVTLLEALGYSYTFSLRYINGNTAIPILGAMVRDGRDFIWLVETPFPGHDELKKEDTSPFEQSLFRQQYPQTEEEFLVPESHWEDLIGEIFHSDEPPRWLLLFAGRYIYLIDRTKWGRGQYLLFDLDEILGRRQTQTLRATAALLSREALCPEDGIPLHDTLDENSHKHAYGVSTDLKYGVRRAVELLGNEFVWYQRNVAKQSLYQDENLARKLTDEALIYLYRLLFLLYAEARAGELDVVPMKAEAYLKGYSLEALRDLEQVPLTTPQAQNGYYLNDSLNRLFSLVDDGHQPQQLALDMGNSAPVTAYDDYGFQVQGLHSPLFNRQSTPLLSSVKFRNFILQEIIQLLSLSRERKGKKYQRGRISYAQLGINQLGAVYEALLSYSGFFAAERLYEVKPADAKEADEIAQTYFIPESELERYVQNEFVYDSETGQRKSYEKGTFIFRLAGRDREKSASYYTPEVLTRCVVKYSLKELLKDKTADDILKITICEPAMGSGAFINEALNQLADAYLERKQKELVKRISPDDYRTERQKVKYFLAVNNAYGVDLNPTAVRLAEVSLWLNILYPGSPTPWFGARLATGNSLIGARRQVYTAEQVKSGAYTNQAPTACPLAPETPEECEVDRIRPRLEGTIYHWLLPDAGMVGFDRDKVIKELAPTETEAIKKWRKEFTKPFSVSELKNLLALTDQADILWQKVLIERQMFLKITHQFMLIWGQPQHVDIPKISIDQHEKDLATLQRSSGPYARLKLAMDYWCALWFWPIPESAKLPTRQQFLEDIAAIFAASEETGFKKTPEQLGLFSVARPKPARFTELISVTLDNLCATNPRLNLVQQLTERLHFHHWELVFSERFAENGGFDLILGNPPWVKLEWNERGILSDYDAILAIRKLSASDAAKKRSLQLQEKDCKADYITEFCEVTANSNFFGSFHTYDVLRGIQINLYQCFMRLAWFIGKNIGYIGFLHPESAYEDPSGGKLRREIYSRLKSHFQFQNQLKLFAEIGDRVRYSVNIYIVKPDIDIKFDHISNLFHPQTIDFCYSHDGLGQVPGMKNKKSNWDLSGHKNRIIKIDLSLLSQFAILFDNENCPGIEAKLPLIHSKETLDALLKFLNHTCTLEKMRGHFYSSCMWHETYSQQDGTIERNVKFPDGVEEWIISGPHFYVASPLNKTPNEGCKSKADYSEINLASIPDNYLPRTVYVSSCTKEEYYSRLPKWNGVPITYYYRHVNRTMLSQAGERTLVNAIIPPGVGNIHAIFSIAFDNDDLLLSYSGLCSSIPYDFFVKSTGKANMLNDIAEKIPIPSETLPVQSIKNRTLRLNCLNIYYRELWENNWDNNIVNEEWTIIDFRLSPWSMLKQTWQRNSALRTPFERRQALLEIDVLASLSLGLSLDELLTIYRAQFPVLYENDIRLRFDQRGMKVPVKTIGGELVVDENHSKFPEMVRPFTLVDREEDYRVAWKFFEERLK
jgi:hypothetical protein